MNPTQHFLRNNIACLQQALDLFENLDVALYTATQAPYYQSSIGDHYRHCIEHYQSFLGGCETGHIDYDARKRDPRIATDLTHACQITEDIMGALRQLSPEDKALHIKLDCDPQNDDQTLWTASTVNRDLQYLQAHTIHHYALIALILRLQDHEPPVTFGVAPSTLKYRATHRQPAE